MSIIDVLTVFLGWMPLVCFFGALFGGEETVGLLAIFAAQGLYPVWIVFFFCFLGEVVADSVWFFIGRSSLISRLQNLKKFKTSSNKARKFIDKKVNGNNFRLLMSTKFLYGLRIASIMYLGRRIKFKTFLLYDIVVAAVWTIVIVGFGWLAGQGIGWLWDTYKNVQMLIVIALCTIIVLYILKKIIGGIAAKWAKK